MNCTMQALVANSHPFSHVPACSLVELVHKQLLWFVTPSDIYSDIPDAPDTGGKVGNNIGNTYCM